MMVLVNLYVSLSLSHGNWIGVRMYFGFFFAHQNNFPIPNGDGQRRHKPNVNEAANRWMVVLDNSGGSSSRGFNIIMAAMANSLTQARARLQKQNIIMVAGMFYRHLLCIYRWLNGCV